MYTQEITVQLTFTEEVLGTASANPDIHAEYIASKAPDAKSMAEEIESIGLEEAVEKSMTVFHKDANGNPFLYDYQIKGFFKDAAKSLKKVTGTVCSKTKAYKQEIDGLLFVEPRQIPMDLHGKTIGNCQRPLRASTAMGERVALANSETVPAGTNIICTIRCYTPQMAALVRECLNYGKDRGIGQWRNSGKGRFTWRELSCETFRDEE